MSLHGLVAALQTSPTFANAARRAGRDADFTLVDGLRAPLIAALIEERQSILGHSPIVLAITATSREAEQYASDLAAFLPDAQIVEFPAWETLPHERLSPSADTTGRRLAAMRELGNWRRETSPERPFVLFASVRAALQPLMPGLDEPTTITLKAGSRGHDLTGIANRLVELAYQRVDMVTRRGEFAVRGGILDVFPPDAGHALRVDFFGDAVDEIRPFGVADQRTYEDTVDEAVLTPSRELLLTESVRDRAREMAPEFPNIEGLLSKIAEGIPVEGMESLAPALVEKLVPIVDYLPEDAAIGVLAPERVASRASDLRETNHEFLEAAWSAVTAGADAPIDLSGGDYVSVKELRDLKGERPWWTFSPFGVDEAGTFHVNGDPVPSFAGNSDGAIDHTVGLVEDGWTVVMAANGQGLVERAQQVLAERGSAGRPVDELPAEGLETGVVYLVKAPLTAGVQLPKEKIALVTESDFYGRAVGYGASAPKKLARRRANAVVDPLQLKAGDHVVHDQHGVGKFLRLEQRDVPVPGTRGKKSVREYLVIEYAPSKRGHPGDKLLVPTDQLSQLTRYVGGEDPSLSKMGGSDWAATKQKARKATKDIAVGLVKLYSARAASKGYAFSQDTPWQHEFEEAFPFVETPDQLQTIEEVKRDMESPLPMDRLLSGDVGFGKTEVAVRAAFKAVQDGKQVVILVPTTLLVRQHHETFTDRMAGFPVQVRAVSRFQTAKETEDTRQGLADGSVDIVIGTHRILSDTFTYKDLGLIIIDEEQRFGVEHKEKLKSLKTNVDVLSMSATPIPRTLEMAVTGIREMSTLATPPEDRHPILTFVGPKSDKQITAAVRRELLREGQVFYVHNRTATINKVAAHLSELVPEARIAVAHGRLSEKSLEQVIVDFWERKFDVLVTTTIVETGLDIPNANTLIIDDAERYGLSQLHQLRGRVGRGRERAYAYFLYDGNRPLTETAHDRLETIAANNELGSGMQVAMKDLEIRGAGNVLGGEQSGHIAGVGFDLYLRMIGEAVDAFKGELPEAQTELRLELPVDARIPDTYIDSERLRLEAYQKLSAAASPGAKPGQIDLVIDELRDRYGEPPAEVEMLFAVSRIRRMAVKLGLSEVVAMGKNLRITPVTLAESKQLRLRRMYPGAKYLEAGHVLNLPLPAGRMGESPSDEEIIEWVRGVFRAMFDATEESVEDAEADEAIER
ncbi:transcription-repair coupling factor [Gulosibacter molinativorax]|uniref:Transcription-repair-coupling factor n=1 Tax=Gulosibacter molinativorax TaxID=256821 RepID=A0ABT7C6P8_9MICO|nr:transcription-repair coupling factor [Gulosibacter molinativorax]MDJ1370822.1 transcription-repair coupling factor [Gulosibacter molinativorax]QUY62159.1 Transcription-repair-coupling factor [Gulosibacter molinativorax]